LVKSPYLAAKILADSVRIKFQIFRAVLSIVNIFDHQFLTILINISKYVR